MPSVPRRLYRSLALGCAALLSLTLSACADKSTEATPGTPSATATSTSTEAMPTLPGDSASASPSASASTKKPTVGTNLDAIKVSGKFGQAPRVTVSKAPWQINKTQSKDLSAGKGRVVSGDDAVVVNYHGVNGRTGKVFDSSFVRGDTAFFPLNGVVAGFKKGLDGHRVGSRVLMAMTGKDGYDAMGGSGDGSIAVGDTLIFVVDIVDASLPEATGTAKAAPKGMPSVTFKKGSPVVTIPKSDPPTKNKVAYLITGKGKKIKSTDQVALHYQWVSWKTGKVIEDSYGQIEVAQIDGLIPGWVSGLKDAPVGSRVLIVSPPDQAYPEGNKEPKVEAGDTIVSVIDILYAYTPKTPA